MEQLPRREGGEEEGITPPLTIFLESHGKKGGRGRGVRSTNFLRVFPCGALASPVTAREFRAGETPRERKKEREGGGGRGTANERAPNPRL